jgi:hypothetical protein
MYRTAQPASQRGKTVLTGSIFSLNEVNAFKIYVPYLKTMANNYSQIQIPVL